MPTVAIAVASIYGVVSLITWVVFGLDKRAARRGARRIPERRLHQLSLAGGWPGALVAMQVFKHKRRKRPFVRTVYVIVSLHVLAWGAAAYFIGFRT